MKFRVEPKRVLREAREQEIKDVRGFSLIIIDHNMELLRGTDRGDCAENNAALQVVEDALDYRLGMAFINLMKSCPKGKLPKPFCLQSRLSGIYATFSSGRTVKVLP